MIRKRPADESVSFLAVMYCSDVASSHCWSSPQAGPLFSGANAIYGCLLHHKQPLSETIRCCLGKYRSKNRKASPNLLLVRDLQGRLSGRQGGMIS